MTDTPTPPPAIDAQDPLPEANWLWRRVFTFIAMALIFLLLFGLATATNRIVTNVVGRIDTMSAIAVAEIAKQALIAILAMFKMMFWSLLVVVTYYMVAPSAEQITKMMQTAGLLKAGVQIASRTLETPDRRETASTAGQPPVPVVPPVASEAPTEGVKAPTEGGAPEDQAPDGPERADFRAAGADSGLPGTTEAPDLPPASTGLKTDTIIEGTNA